MLRLLRISGIIIFAGLIGYSANALREMKNSGEWFEPYNSAPKAKVALMAFSVIALSALGYLEVSILRRRGQRRGYGGSRYTDKNRQKTDGLDTRSIYAAPKTAENWSGTRRGGNEHRSRNKPKARRDKARRKTASGSQYSTI